MEIKLAENDSALLGILELQNDNHLANVSLEDIQSEGFVTVKHTLDSLKKMQHLARQVIAVDNERVVAYALVMLPEHRDLIPVLVPMFNSLETIIYKGKRLTDHSFYVMGQVCIAEAYRGSGVFKLLYEKHRQVYSKKFEMCITEVSSNNPRSIKAHSKVGFETLHTFRDETDEWHIIVWDWSRYS